VNVFDVLIIISDLNRAGVAPTANACSKVMGESVYITRKITHQAASMGLVGWKTVHHREHVQKRVYSLTHKGCLVVEAYTGKLPGWQGGKE